MSDGFVCYYRVSTSQQSKSGLGLEGQKDVVADYILKVGGFVVDEFVEVESGKRNDRQQLEAAIRKAKTTKAKLVIAKLDRFSRKVSFVSGLMDKGVDFVVAEMPNATPFQLHIHSAMAEEEVRLISQRTSIALQKAKERGVKLGLNGRVLAKRNKKEANAFAKTIKTKLKTYMECGMSYNDIAKALNADGVVGFRGGRFYASTIRNYSKRLRLI